MITGTFYASQAMSDRYTGIPYSKLDCQAFVEEVLKDCGVRRADGTPYNWAGSNSMWRNALSWKGTINECLATYGDIPLGAWVFIVKRDGKETERGYHDNEGNATHVGIYVRNTADEVRDSTKTATRDGVGYRTLKGFTHVGLPKMVNFSTISDTEADAEEAIRIIRKSSSTERQILEALETLTDYMKGW